MRNLLLVAVGLWGMVGCASLMEEEPMDQLAEGIDVYDESQVPQASEPSPNLLQNGDFESQEAWLLCEGGAYYDEDPTAPFGRGVMRFSDQGQVCDEGYFGFGTVAQISQEIPVRGDESQLVISFWMRVEGTLPDNISFSVYLANAGDPGLGADYFVGATPTETSGGWMKFQRVVTPDDWDFYLDNTPIYLLLRIRNLDGAEVFIDEVKVQEEIEYTQASPMPSDLANYSGEDRLVFINWSNETMAIMAPNGSQMVNLEHISSSVAQTPSWAPGNDIAVSFKHFYPQLPQEVTTVPGAGTDLMRFNMNGGEGEKLYFTIGNPGKYYFSGSFDNVDALDVEIWNADWDLPRDRVAMGICARNRSPDFVSDDVCFVYITDSNFEILNDETRGANPKWSAQGELVYYTHDGIAVAQVNGKEVQSEIVYPGRFNLLNVADWSPDGKKLVLAQQEGATTLIAGEIVYYYTIKILDLASRTVRTLLPVNHGKLYTDLTYSKDGQYVFYTLGVQGGMSQIWWVDVLTGATGPVTNTISAGYANMSH